MEVFQTGVRKPNEKTLITGLSSTTRANQMIRPNSRIDMVEVLPNFGRIPYANDLHTNFDLIQKAFIRSPRSILLGS